MSRRRVEITQDGPRKTSIKIDGHEIADKVKRDGWTLTTVDGLAVLDVTLFVYEGTVARSGYADVRIDDRMHELLTWLGWTPPRDDRRQQ